mgnify:CR=1 FL=1
MKVTKQETLYHKDHGATLNHKCGKRIVALSLLFYFFIFIWPFFFYLAFLYLAFLSFFLFLAFLFFGDNALLMMIITLLFTYNSRITTRYLEQNITLCGCLRRCTGICNESRVTCMKELSRWPCHKYDVNYMIMQKQYDNDGACHNKRNGGKLHGNIS